MTQDAHIPRARSQLHEVVAAQDGYFSAEQAQDAGYSAQLLRYHCQTGKFQRVRRGIYRVAEYPPGEREDLVILWLWSGRLGVFSHGTALSLHELSDLLPDRVHMTLPESQRKRLRKTPPGLMLHYRDLAESEHEWHGNIPVTSPRRTLLDGVADALSPDLLRQALEQAVERGLLDVASITEIARGIDELERG
ncbi:MAG: hypothetical protein HC927_10835 [Deltaproteobacteria bacterium]|nr:hypothetical protein [Deltaproteobacteria bacterium]